MEFLLVEYEIPHGEEALLRRLEPINRLILRDAAKTPRIRT
jgi:hypothetical protein